MKETSSESSRTTFTYFNSLSVLHEPKPSQIFKVYNPKHHLLAVQKDNQQRFTSQGCKFTFQIGSCVELLSSSSNKGGVKTPLAGEGTYCLSNMPLCPSIPTQTSSAVNQNPTEPITTTITISLPSQLISSMQHTGTTGQHCHLPLQINYFRAIFRLPLTPAHPLSSQELHHHALCSPLSGFSLYPAFSSQPPKSSSTRLRLLIYGQLLQVTLLSASSQPSLTASFYLKVRPHTKRSRDFPDNRTMNNYKQKKA